MLKLFLQISGWLLAHTPGGLLHAWAWCLGRLMLAGMRERRRLIFSNLFHAFPDRPRAWHVRVARLSCVRLVETGMLSLASPFFSDERIRRTAVVAPELRSILQKHVAEQRPLLIGTLHLAYWEGLTWLGLLAPEIKGTGVVFRPLRNPTLNVWVQRTRERHGLLLLSRREGFQDTIRILRGNGRVALLFDQNPGRKGALTIFLGRICFTSELAGLLAEKVGARVVVFYPRRTGFWRMRFEAAEIESDGTTAGITLAMNRWFEKTLAQDEQLCASWLWSHSRWRAQQEFDHRFNLVSKRDILDEDLAARGMTRATMPRKTRIWLRLPDDENAVADIAPLVQAARLSRPDAEFTLLSTRGLEMGALPPGVADRVIALPASPVARWCLARRLRGEFPDSVIVLDESRGADFEAWLIDAPQRYGLCGEGGRRRLLTMTQTVDDAVGASLTRAERWRRWWIILGLPA